MSTGLSSLHYCDQRSHTFIWTLPTFLQDNLDKTTMKLSLLTLFVAPFATVAAPVEEQKPPAFFLAGDSTTAVNGGWGDGFLATLRNGAIGANKGHSGTTTASFVARGDWRTVVDLVKKNSAQYHCYVTIQFGHNDQVSHDLQ
jgi:hypothetical protein